MATRAVLSATASAFSRPPVAVNLVIRRRFSAGGEHHGPSKVNIWEDPLSPSKWKEEHFVLASLGSWGLLIYGGYKHFGGNKENKEEVLVPAAPNL